MRLTQYIERGPQQRRARKSKPKKASIASHGAFVPLFALWGAALLGLAVVVLPEIMVNRMSALTGYLVTGNSARYSFAAVAAVLGGALAFVISGAIHSKVLRRDGGRPIAAAVTARRISPIDPATDLGSDSLDSPLEGMPFGDGELGFAGDADDIFELTEEPDDSEAVAEPAPAKVDASRKPTLGELAARNYELEEPAAPAKKSKKKGKEEVAFTHRQFQSALIESCEGATCEASSAADAEAGILARKPQRAQAPAPRALDLEEFGQLPGRNGVWVEEAASPAPQAPVAATIKPKAKRPLVPASALEKLRQTPPDQLSLVEMVERFAGALHEHQQSERARRPDGGAGRDMALVEALKALTLFTEQGFDIDKSPTSPIKLSETERELRSALAKLQTLRGAA